MGPLDGVRVIEIASLAPAPFGCMILSDLGAEVVRVDRAERCGPDAKAPVDPLSRGRRSIGINLKDPAGVELLLRLVASADVLVEGFRPGVTELHWESWPRIDDAIESYAVFARLRADGVIPAGLRFQIGLPFPASALNGFKADFAADFPVAARGFEDLVARELARLTAAIPPGDLAIQWDLAYETQDIERVLAWTPEGAWERFAGPVTRLTRLIPSDVLVGYHLCYGTFPEWPMYEARDMALLVRMANFAVANSGRPVDWLHLAGPRYLRSEDRSFFRPLADLEPGDARVFLGIVLPIDGVPGLRRRHATASRYLSDFGVAMYCGFGRQPGPDGNQTMREHAHVVRAIRT